MFLLAIDAYHFVTSNMYHYLTNDFQELVEHLNQLCSPMDAMVSSVYKNLARHGFSKMIFIITNSIYHFT